MTKKLNVPKFESEAEEAEWWDQHREETAQWMEEAVAAGETTTLSDVLERAREGSGRAPTVTVRVDPADAAPARVLMEHEKPQKDLPEEELLLPYERKMMQGEWRTYFKAARQCWLASINNFPELWRLFLQLDEIFIREFHDCEKQRNPHALLPLLLFIKAHKSVRVAAELAFSTHFSEAYDATRSAIESAVFAHKIYRERGLAEVWLQKGHGAAQRKAFEKAFVFYKQKNLFPDTFPFLAELYKTYSLYSDWGTHTSVASVGLHYHGHEDDKSQTSSICYVGADLQQIATIIETLIHAFWQIEKALHDAFSSRLCLDPQLEQMRGDFAADKRRIAAALTKRFNIKGPPIIPP